LAANSEPGEALVVKLDVPGGSAIRHVTYNDVHVHSAITCYIDKLSCPDSFSHWTSLVPSKTQDS